MTSELKIEDLEKALLDRAHSLSIEYAERARRSHDHFIEDENERLRLREEREVMAAKMKADQMYRSLVQAEELHTLETVDKLRWSLMNKVLDDVAAHLKELAQDKNKYLQLLKELLQQSLEVIPAASLIVELNELDHQQFVHSWETITDTLNTDKSIQLSDKFCISSGGFIIYDEQRMVRVDNTFEGRMHRLSEEVNQIIAEHLFSEVIPVRSNIHDR